MIVVDASIMANALGDDGPAGDSARRAIRAGGDLAAPDLVDVETIAALRRRWLSGTISDQRLQAAADYLLDLPVTRYPTLPFMKRAIALRANVSAYDACYVALAETLDCPLLTGDRRLANAPGVRCKFKLITEH